MILHKRFLAAIILPVVMLLGVVGSAHADASLNLDQCYQEQTQWCWAGTTQSVLRLYGYNLTQTTIAAYGTDGANEWNWLWGESTNPTRRGIDMILSHFAVLTSTGYGYALSASTTENLMQASRPTFIRWGWDSGGGHFVLPKAISGSTWTLMDPWYGPTINDYSWVVSGGGHTWTHSLSVDTGASQFVVSSFSINGGAASTTSTSVTLNNTVTGSTPTQYMASESSTFMGGTWQTYSNSPSFTLTSDYGTKTVYFKVKNSSGIESVAVTDTIQLSLPGDSYEPDDTASDAKEITSGQVQNRSIHSTGDVDWAKFTLSVRSEVIIETTGSSGGDTVMGLYGPNSSTVLIEENDDGNGLFSRISRTGTNALDPGVYYINVRDYWSNQTISAYTLSLSATAVETIPVVSSFSINSGAASTTSTSVTLNNTVTGSTPTHYMASESPTFIGATWQTYSNSPSFTLSSDYGTKTVYFKVKNSSGIESVAVSDTIQFIEPIPVVSSFSINSGAASTTSTSVTLNNTVTGSTPTQYMASESSTFMGATWQTYSNSPSFTLSSGYGTKTVYFKVKNSSGIESVAVNDTIQFIEPTPVVSSFSINSGAASTTSTSVTLNNTVTGSTPSHYMASESPTFLGAIWQTYSNSPSFRLSSGYGTKTVYFKVKNSSGIESVAVSESILFRGVSLVPWLELLLSD